MAENENQPIGEPQPIDPREGRKILKRLGGVLAATAGFAFFAALLLPTRTSGASRSARLQWQQRQNEIQEVINKDQSDPAKDSHSDGTAEQ